MSKRNKWMIAAAVLLVLGLILCAVAYWMLGSDFKKLSTVKYETRTFEVKEDFIEAVKAARGTAFADKYIEKRDGKYFADMVSMNFDILASCGVAQEHIDVCGACTACEPERYHSHRATGGLRGTMGSVIGIKHN